MRATGRSSAHFKTRSTSNPALSVPSVLEDVPRPPPNMSDDAAQAQREADAPAVGTVRKAEDAPGGDAERAAPRAKVSAEDLARALGGAAATAAVKADTSDAPGGRMLAPRPRLTRQTSIRERRHRLQPAGCDVGREQRHGYALHV